MLFDFNKAFDAVSNTVLFDKMRQLEESSPLLNEISDFLIGHTTGVMTFSFISLVFNESNKVLSWAFYSSSFMSTTYHQTSKVNVNFADEIK